MSAATPPRRAWQRQPENSSHPLATKGSLAEDGCDIVKDPQRGLGYANLTPRMWCEVVVKRAFMADHMLVVRHDGDTLTVIGCVRCSESGYDLSRPDSPPDLTGPCPTLRHMALLYDDHPDFDETWRQE